MTDHISWLEEENSCLSQEVIKIRSQRDKLQVELYNARLVLQENTVATEHSKIAIKNLEDDKEELWQQCTLARKETVNVLRDQIKYIDSAITACIGCRDALLDLKEAKKNLCSAMLIVETLKVQLHALCSKVDAEKVTKETVE